MDTIDRQSASRATLYRASLYAWIKEELSDVEIFTDKYAQHKNAVIIECALKGKSKRSRMALTSTDAVLLHEWDHPSPPGALGPTQQRTSGPLILHEQATRFDSCAPEWGREFEFFLSQYLKESGNKIWIDLRQYNFEA